MGNNVKEIELQQMGPMRDASQKVSQMLAKKLSAHLSTITPLFAPRKVLGEYMESAFKDKILGAEENFKKVEEKFKEICRAGFNMPMKLSTPVTAIKNQLEIYPWTYLYQIGGDASQTITVSSPTRWVLSYAGSLDLARIIKHKNQGEALKGEDVKELVLNSLVLNMILEKTAGIKVLLEDLRYSLSVENSPVSGALPYIVLSSPVPSFRPQDDLIKTVTQLSGLPMFEELIDMDSIDGLPDPYKDAILKLKS